MGEILFDLEDVLDELIDSYGLQWGDIFDRVHKHLVQHRPDAQEEYEDGGSPVFYYGAGDEDYED